MRILTASLAVGSLMLLGVMHVAAAQPTAPDPKTQLAADATSPGDRNTYTRTMQDYMQEWQQKVRDFDEVARAKGRQADIATADTLNAAWAKTQVEAGKVSVATTEGWASAKASYEYASRQLANAWDKAHH